MKAIYSTRVTAVGGRAGTVRSEDGLFETALALPKSMGGKGDATNPEQLFAAGYAACFENAILHVARAQKLALADKDVEVTAEVGVGLKPDGAFQLAVTMETAISGLDQARAETLVEQAHKVCPYSNAVRGNVEVTNKVTAR